MYAPGRELLLHGTFKKVSLGSSEKIIKAKHEVCVFTDIILFAAIRRKDRLKCVYHCTLSHVVLAMAETKDGK